MSGCEPGPLVACVDASEEILGLLADYLRLDGFRTAAHVAAARRGVRTAIDFLRELRPDACLFTVSPPYAEGWREFQALRAAVPDVPIVLTTTNGRALENAVGPVEGMEILSMPYDLDEVCRAVRRAFQRRAHSAA